MHFFRRSLVVRPPGRSRCAMCYKSYIVEQAKVEWRWRRTRTDKNMPWIRTRVTISPNCLLLLLAILRCHKFNLQAPRGSVLLLVCALFNHATTKEKRAKTIRSLKKCRGSHPTNLIPNIIHTRSGGCCTTNFFSFFFCIVLSFSWNSGSFLKLRRAVREFLCDIFCTWWKGERSWEITQGWHLLIARTLVRCSRSQVGYTYKNTHLRRTSTHLKMFVFIAV